MYFHHNWQHWGFEIDSCVLMAASWVDNLHAAGTSASSAIHILDDIAMRLQEDWSLAIKPGSRSVMVAQGGDTTSPLPEEWDLCNEFHCLGHVLQDNGSIQACVPATVRGCWKAFWKHFGSRRYLRLTLTNRIKAMSRRVTPLVRFRGTRWPPQTTAMHRLD